MTRNTDETKLIAINKWRVRMRAHDKSAIVGPIVVIAKYSKSSLSDYWEYFHESYNYPPKPTDDLRNTCAVSAGLAMFSVDSASAKGKDKAISVL